MQPLIAVASALIAGLLVVAGAGKVWRPRPTAQALYAAGLPGSEPAVRGLGLIEIVAGTALLLRPAPWNALLAGSLYLGFAGFVSFLLLARPSATSCGCAGARSAPPSWIHVGLNLTAAAAAVVAAIVGIPSLATTASDLGWLAVPAAAGVACAGWLTAVVATEVPGAIGAWAAPSHHELELFDPDRHRRADVALAGAGIEPGHASLWPDHDPATDVPLEGIDVGR